MGAVINVAVSGQQTCESAVQRCGSALAVVGTIPLLGSWLSPGVAVFPACCKPETGNTKVTVCDVLVSDAWQSSVLTSRLSQCSYRATACA